MKKRLHKHLTNVFVLCIAVIVCFVIVEIGVRIASPQALYDECHKNHPDYPQTIKIDDNLGWAMNPETSWCLYQPDTNEKILLTTNSKGIRGTTEYSYQKPPNTFRVLVFGDSFAWGENLHDNQTFHEQLKTQLEARVVKKNVNIEVIAFGVKGFGTTQSYVQYLMEGAKYNADLVVYLFYQNDVTDSYTANSGKKAKPIAQVIEINNDTFIKIYFPKEIRDLAKKRELDAPSEDTNTTKSLIPPGALKAFALGNSHFAMLLEKTLAEQKKEKGDTNLIRLSKKIALSQKGFYNQMKKDELFDAGTKAVEVTLANWKNLAADNNAQFFLVTIPSVYEILDKHKETFDTEVKKWHEKTGRNGSVESSKLIEALYHPQRKNHYTQTIMSKHNILGSDLTLIARQNNQTFFHKTDTHWTPHGVRISAEQVVRDLEEQGVLS